MDPWIPVSALAIMSACATYSPTVRSPEGTPNNFSSQCPVVALAKGSEGGASCGKPSSALRKSRACAQSATSKNKEDAVTAAMREHGLVKLSVSELAKRRIGMVPDHGGHLARSNYPKDRVFEAGLTGGIGNYPTAYAFLAVKANAPGDSLVLVRVTPAVTTRSYKTCSCPQMYGTEPPRPEMSYYVLPEGTTLTKTVPVPYDALVISGQGIRRGCEPVP